MRQSFVAAALLLAIFSAGTASAKPVHYKVTDQSKVAFTSNAPVEVINGKTDEVNGEIRFDDSFKFDAQHPFKINFAIDLGTFDTGIELRNQHMRDNFLETSRYPKATFTATSIKLDRKPDLRKAQTVNLLATGDFTLHGVTVKKTIPLKVAYTPAVKSRPAAVKIDGRFPIPLVQHQIKRPEMVLQKLADTIYVDLDLIAQAQ